MDWTQIFPTLNGIVGGVIMALVGWLVGTGKLHLGRETALYKDLWAKEQEKTRKLEEVNDQLTEDLRKNNETLVQTSTSLSRSYDDLARMNAELVQTNRQLTETNTLMKELTNKRKADNP